MNRNMLTIAATRCGLALALSAGAQQASRHRGGQGRPPILLKALSARDAKAMEAVWANKPYVINIGPRDTNIAVGFADAVSRYWPQSVRRNA